MPVAGLGVLVVVGLPSIFLRHSWSLSWIQFVRWNAGCVCHQKFADVVRCWRDGSIVPSHCSRSVCTPSRLWGFVTGCCGVVYFFAIQCCGATVTEWFWLWTFSPCNSGLVSVETFESHYWCLKRYRTDGPQGVYADYTAISLGLQLLLGLRLALRLGLVVHPFMILRDFQKYCTAKIAQMLQKKFEWDLSRLLHTELHWLDVPERVMYKLSVMMYSCLHGQAPQYLLDVCQPVSDVASRRRLRSAGRRLLYRTRGGVHLPGGLSLWLARWCGIRCQTTWETRQSAETLSASRPFSWELGVARRDQSPTSWLLRPVLDLQRAAGVSVCDCVSRQLLLNEMTSELSRPLVGCFTLTLSKSWVVVHGHTWKNVAEVIGLMWSEGCLVYYTVVKNCLTWNRFKIIYYVLCMLFAFCSSCCTYFWRVIIARKLSTSQPSCSHVWCRIWDWMQSSKACYSNLAHFYVSLPGEPTILTHLIVFK